MVEVDSGIISGGYSQSVTLPQKCSLVVAAQGLSGSDYILLNLVALHPGDTFMNNQTAYGGVSFSSDGLHIRMINDESIVNTFVQYIAFQ